VISSCCRLPGCGVVAPAMSETTTLSDSNTLTVEKLVKLAHTARWEELDEQWLAAVGTPEFWEFHPDFEKLFIKVKEKKHPAQVTAMLELALEELAGNDMVDPGHFIDIFAVGYPHGPASSSMRTHLLTLAKRMLDEDTLKIVMQLSKLDDDEVTAKKAVDDFLRYCRLTPGEVYHHHYYQVGIIRSIDAAEEVLKMDFPNSQYQDITVKFEHMEELLKPMPRGHFDVLRLKDPDAVKTLADSEPGELVRRIAKARHGDVKQSMIKEILLAGVFTAAEFKNWWAKKRNEIVRDPYLDVTGSGASCLFKLRESPKPYFQEILTSLNEVKNFKDRHQVCRRILTASREDAFPTEAWERTLDPFRKAAIESDKIAPHERIGWQVLANDLQEEAPEGISFPKICDITEEIKRVPRATEVIVQLETPEHIAAMLPVVREAFPDEWPQLYGELAELLTPRLVDSILKTLHKEGHDDIASHTVERIISFPERNADAYIWAMRALIEDSAEHINAGLDKSHLIEDLLKELEALENTPGSVTKAEEREVRALANKISKYLSEKQFSIVAQLVEKMDGDEARTFYAEIDKRRLPQDFRDSMRAALRKTRNDLEEESTKKKAAAAEAAVLKCTAESHAEKLAEYNNINEKEIPENSKAIGAAAELGDLKENAEYHAAKERQKILFRRVEELSMQLQRARIVETGNISESEAGFGGKITVKNKDGGDAEVYTILGPWESDPEKKIISYEAPLGKVFVGRKLNEEFTADLPGGKKQKLTITKIEKAY
jgi:transcription elongation factor GreA